MRRFWDGTEKHPNSYKQVFFFPFSLFIFFYYPLGSKFAFASLHFFIYSSTWSITQSVVHIYWVKIITEKKSPKLFFCQLYFAFLIRENIRTDRPHVVDRTIWIFLIPGSFSAWDRFNFSSHVDTSWIPSFCVRKILPYTCVKTQSNQWVNNFHVKHEILYR